MPIRLDYGSRTVHCDEDGTLTVARSLDVETLLHRNAAERNHGTNGYTPSREMRKIASIDVVTLDRWAQQDGLPVHWMRMAGDEFARWIKRKLREETRFLTVDRF